MRRGGHPRASAPIRDRLAAFPRVDCRGRRRSRRPGAAAPSASWKTSGNSTSSGRSVAPPAASRRHRGSSRRTIWAGSARAAREDGVHQRSGKADRELRLGRPRRETSREHHDVGDALPSRQRRSRPVRGGASARSFARTCSSVSPGPSRQSRANWRRPLRSRSRAPSSRKAEAVGRALAVPAGRAAAAAARPTARRRPGCRRCAVDGRERSAADRPRAWPATATGGRAARPSD